MKKLFVSVVVGVVLLAMAVFILPILLTSDAMRQEFSTRVSSMSGMDIALNGPVNFSIVPDFGVVADQVHLSAPDGSFSVSAAKIVAGVKLSSVFSGKVEITGLDVRQPEIFVDASKTAAPPQNGATTNNTGNRTNKDPFASAVGTLESLALNRLTISNGTFISRAIDDTQSVVRDINAELRAPSLDGEMQLAFAAIADGQKLTLNASLDALRPILQRKPSGIDIALKMEPAPHPVLTDLTLKGVIQLAEDGSYRISDGRIATLGQPMRIDALYRPGERPYGSLSVQADKVDLGTIEQAISEPTNAPSGTKRKPDRSSVKNEQDLSALAAFDGELKLNIGSFSMDGAEIRNINLQGVLKQGILQAKLGNATIANGKVGASVKTDFNGKSPTSQGSLTASSLALADIARLANANLPLMGNFGLSIGYAFRGMDEYTIKNSLNFAGNIGLSNGVLSVPELAEAGLGKNAGTISDLNMQATVKHIQKPIAVKGKMNWQGEAISFTTQISPRSFIQDGNGKLSLAVTSKNLKADYVGNLSLNGSADGSTNISTASLGNLMAWLGQGANPQMKDFAYSGNIKVDPENFKFTKSSITLNGNRAVGSGSISMAGKPSIVTNLSFSSLDIAALTGGTSNGSKANAGNSGGNSTGSSDSPLDLSALRGFDANITLQANKLGYGKVSAGPVKTLLTVKDGAARVSLPSTQFYGGNVAAEIVANGSAETAAISINAKLAGVDASTLFRDAADFERLQGKLNASIKTNGAGKTTNAFAKSLQGNASAKFTDGAIKGIDVAKIYNNLAAIVVTGFKENAGDRTEFSELGLSFAIAQGIATTNDIKLVGPAIEMDGAGNVNLGEETIDMRLNPRFVGQSDTSTVKIPVIIRGALSSPLVYPDLTEILKNPQAALNSLSKLGLNLKGLSGNGEKVDLKQLALDKLKDPDAVKQIGSVIEQLIPNKGSEGGANDVIGSLLGNLSDSSARSAQNQETPSNVFEGLKPASGAIAIPTQSPIGGQATNNPPAQKTTPRVRQTAAPAPQNAEQDDLKLEKPIDDLLKNLFN